MMSGKWTPDAPCDPEHVLAEAWPAGVPAAERALFASLPGATKAQVLARLEAVTRAKNADLTALANELQMSRTGFFQLRKRWSAERSIAVLIPNARNRKRSGGVKRPKAALAARRAAPDRTPSGLAIDLQSVADASVPTLRRLVRRERRAAATEPEALQRTFGSAFAIDQSALDLPIITDSGIEWALGCFFLERTSGLILAAKVDRMRHSSETVADTLCAAAGYAERHALRVLPGSDGVVQLDVVLGDQGNVPQFVYERNRMPEVLGIERVHGDKPFRFGRFLLNAVGSGVDGIGFRPRTKAVKALVPPAFLKQREPVSVTDAGALLRRAVKRHNEPIEKTLRSLSLIEDVGNPTPLIRLIRLF